MKAFFDMMHDPPRKLVLFGAACTHVTDPMAKASKHWNLAQVRPWLRTQTHTKGLLVVISFFIEQVIAFDKI